MFLRSRSPVAKEWPVNKRKKNKVSISSLPDDLVLSCLARVSRLYYPTLSLVSKRLRSLIASPELYKVRSLLGLTESCLYICLKFPRDSRWFTLHRRSKKEKTNRSSENILVPIPSRNCDRASVVAVGSSIYSIGGLVNNTPSTSVSVLDCRSHTWHQAPNMSVARKSVVGDVIDGKIYVIGGRLKSDYNSSSWIEVFDPETLIWNSLSSPGQEVCGSEKIRSIVIDGKIFMCGYKFVAYNPKDGTCEPMGIWGMFGAWNIYSHCVVDNVLFYHYDKGFRWFDTRARLWKEMKGLEGMPQIYTHTRFKLGDYGGKIAFLWDKHDSSIGRENKEIWCTVIAIERYKYKNEDEIWGTVEWFGSVLTVPKCCRFECVLSATL